MAGNIPGSLLATWCGPPTVSRARRRRSKPKKMLQLFDMENYPTAPAGAGGFDRVGPECPKSALSQRRRAVSTELLERAARHRFPTWSTPIAAPNA